MSETHERMFTIDGTEYPIPSLVSFTMDEAEVFYTANGYPVEDLWPVPAEDDHEGLRVRLAQLRHPSVTRALLHVAYVRGNPGATSKKVGEVVGEVRLIDALLAYIPNDDDDEREKPIPLDTTSEPDASSPGSSLDENKSSGTVSMIDSGALVVLPARIGTIGWDTSPTSDQGILAT